jgi:hypothetical protein
MREDFIHFHARKTLRATGWTLLAGQYPNGSDDELSAMSIVDPLLARDLSPDPRRHGLRKLVPDIVALLGRDILIVEAKPTYDRSDERKLVDIITSRRADTLHALAATLLRASDARDVSEFRLVPCLAMSASSNPPRRDDFAYLFMSNGGEAELTMPVLSNV